MSTKAEEPGQEVPPVPSAAADQPAVVDDEQTVTPWEVQASKAGGVGEF